MCTSTNQCFNPPHVALIRYISAELEHETSSGEHGSRVMILMPPPVIFGMVDTEPGPQTALNSSISTLRPTPSRFLYTP